MRRLVTAALALVLPLLSAPIANAAPATIEIGTDFVQAAVDRTGSRVFVSRDQSYEIGVYDVATRQRVDTIPTGAYPLVDFALSPSGDRLYALAGWNTDSSVLVFDTATLTRLATLPIPKQRGADHGWNSGWYENVAVSADGTTLYLTQGGPWMVKFWRPGRLIVLPIATPTAARDLELDTVRYGYEVGPITASPTGRDVYVEAGGGTVHVDPSTSPPVTRGTFTRDSNHTRATSTFDHPGTTLFYAAPGRDVVQFIDPRTDRTTAELPLGAIPTSLTAHPDGRLFTSDTPPDGPSRITVIDTATRTVTAHLTEADEPAHLSLSADGHTLAAAIGHSAKGKPRVVLLPV
ncbi:hypothetical protein [Actinosynnema sp. NPDC020468]|uniref:YncE family protein n=1 Tax=Actinosynnema sp. NPDC020468 TaxID=3154488 RepID=UPI0033F44B1E